MRYEVEINPIKRRRVSLGLSQKDMASRLGITQSQYSRVEKSKTDPEKYIDRLAVIFGCAPEEIFGQKIMNEIQRDFLNSPSKKQAMHFDETKMDFVYLDVRGWFSKDQFTDFARDVQNGFVEIKAWKEEQENEGAKYRQAEALANWDGVSSGVELPPKKGD
tara:strand:+ start:92 stop:577 length:486 start_codon:yes stop_codon:yes gene_type:complete